MSYFEIHGESKSLSVKQIEFLSDVLEKLGFKGNKVSIKSFGKAGDNYAANVKRIIVDKSDGTAFKMIAKVAPTIEFIRNTFCTGDAFANEIILYNEVFPQLRQLEIAAGIPEDSRFTFPVCYGICQEVPHELVLLEDLSEDNYVMLDKNKSLTNEEVVIIIKSIAKLHSLSFIWREKDPVTYRKVVEKLRDNFTNPSMQTVLEQVSPAVIENMNSLISNDNYKKIITKVFQGFIPEAHKIKEYDVGSPYSVIIHGDLWINNILFKLEGNKLQKCMFIDYQQSNEKSPVADFLFVVNSSTDNTTRAERLREWMDLYHDELGNRLSIFGLDVKDVYPKDKLWEDYKRYIDFSVCQAIFVANLFSLDTNEVTRLKDTIETSVGFDNVVSNFNPEHLKDDTVANIKDKVEGILNFYYEKSLK